MYAENGGRYYGPVPPQKNGAFRKGQESCGTNYLIDSIKYKAAKKKMVGFPEMGMENSFLPSWRESTRSILRRKERCSFRLFFRGTSRKECHRFACRSRRYAGPIDKETFPEPLPKFSE
ncbi:hypothetical protein HMPREF1986_00517 [Oribacterium sp. oral taxon 078 str. F0263]|nr:hypothetical protein HMPREF1986_00517 [Oribacterium sp. oral taxon 078 str. F0263]